MYSVHRAALTRYVRFACLLRRVCWSVGVGRAMHFDKYHQPASSLAVVMAKVCLPAELAAPAASFPAEIQIMFHRILCCKPSRLASSVARAYPTTNNCVERASQCIPHSLGTLHISPNQRRLFLNVSTNSSVWGETPPRLNRLNILQGR